MTAIDNPASGQPSAILTPDQLASIALGEPPVEAKKSGPSPLDSAGIDLGRFERFINAKPPLPRGDIPLPATLRPTIEKYDHACQALSDALDEVGMAQRAVAFARDQDRKATERAFVEGKQQPALTNLDAAERRITEAEVAADARLVLASRAAAEVRRSVESAVPEMRSTIAGLIDSTAKRGMELVDELEATAKRRHDALTALRLLDTNYTVRRLPTMATIDVPRPSDAGRDWRPHRLQGVNLRALLAQSGEDVRRRFQSFSLKPARRWFEHRPESLDWTPDMTAAERSAGTWGPVAATEPTTEPAKTASSKKAGKTASNPSEPGFTGDA